jgi:fermentation-respiration switch protein FrsA (DUF1100 family)
MRSTRTMISLLGVASLAAALVALVAAVRLLEPRMAFFPNPGESRTPRDFGVDYEPVSIATADGEQLRGWWLRPPSPTATILYFHGNGGNLSMWAPILADIARRGYAMLAFDYRGYGLSTGRPSEQGLYRDVDAVVDYFSRDTSSVRPRVYWGRSLGVVMAAYGSTTGSPDGLVLESGFPSARSLLRGSPVLFVLSFLSSYRFPSAEFVRGRTRATPVLVLHGDDDHIVPIQQGRALYELMPDPKQFVAIRGGDHNDATPADPATYWQAVNRFVTGLPRK